MPEPTADEVAPAAAVSTSPDRLAGGPRDRWTRRELAWLALVLGLAAPVLLVALDGGTLRPYDEGLYGQLARNALAHGEYLHAVGPDGELHAGFTKPPLAIACVALSFRVLGVSMLALRLPFALSMLGLVAVAFAWGRRIGGLSFAVAWAGCLLGVAASFRWGRAACIEPMLMLWIVTGLWAYHEALVRTGARAWGWALAAGLALALAVATKQVVVGLAVVPIVAMELWRREGRRAWARVAVVLGVPALVGVAWLWLMIGRVGDAALEIYVRTGVVRRVAGFESGHGARSLNELSETVAEACMPFPWVLGVAGLVVLVLARWPGRRAADGALLLPLLLVTATLVYDNASQSMLPWYAFDFVPPLTAGVAFMIAGLVKPGRDGLGLARMVGGALALGVGAVGMLAPVVSQLDAAVVVGVAVVVLVRRASGGAARSRTIVRLGRIALLAGAAAAFALGTWRRPELRTRPGGHEQLMRELAARGIARVAVDTDARLSSDHSLGTYYGPYAQWVPRPPWRRGEPASQAYVTSTIWPLELQPENGSEVLRAPGVMALVGGELDRPAWSHGTLESLLVEGPLTFEAEHLPSQRPDALVGDPAASGGLARARVPFAGRREQMFLLTHGPQLALPAGRYEASFELRWDCHGAVGGKPAAILHVEAGESLAELELACETEGMDGYRAVPVEFRLPRRGAIELRVQYVGGSVWHDRTVLRRR
jgi:4-amino-4-deoxy-L-arabinose transferase-like glycosyltransferase